MNKWTVRLRYKILSSKQSEYVQMDKRIKVHISRYWVLWCKWTDNDIYCNTLQNTWNVKHNYNILSLMCSIYKLPLLLCSRWWFICLKYGEDKSRRVRKFTNSPRFWRGPSRHRNMCFSFFITLKQIKKIQYTDE